MKVSVVIPNYSHFHLINDLLASIVKYNPHQIIVVDDCSPDEETIKGLDWWKENYGIEVFRQPKNLGFLRNSNFGMLKADGDVLVLISTDVIIETDFIYLINKALLENPKRLVGGIVYNSSTGWNQFGQRVFNYAEGWLLACTKEAWLDLGGFDERFIPSDYEDVDISTTALEKGYELYSLNEAKIRHIGGQSIGYNEQREEQTRRNRNLFEAKWIVNKT